MSVEKSPCFALEHRIFDHLTTAEEIAIYAHINRKVYAGKKATISRIIKKLGLTQEQADDACAKLLLLGVFEQN